METRTVTNNELLRTLETLAQIMQVPQIQTYHLTTVEEAIVIITNELVNRVEAKDATE